MNNLEGFQIKMATKDDSIRIIQMLKHIAQWLKNRDIKQWGYLLEGGDDEEIEQSITNHETYVVLKEDELVATFTLLSQQSEWDSHIWGEGDYSNSFFLHRLALDPAYMKKGLGGNILNWIENKFSNDVEYIKLDCVSDNEKLNNFYKNNGYELIGIYDGHNKYQKRIQK